MLFLVHGALHNNLYEAWHPHVSNFDLKKWVCEVKL